MALLEVTDLVVHYGKALALEGVSLTVAAGELVAVLGPNGAGKSTLLKAISRAVPMSRGHIAFAGQSLDAVPAHKVVAAGICHCPEGRRLFPELSVLKNLQLGAYLRNDRDGIAADLARVYTLFPVLRERSRQQASTLSGGEQQMVAIGRALMGKPKLLLLDEPSVGIAHRLKVQIFQCHPPDPARRHRDPAGRAGRALGARHCQPRLSAGTRPRRPRGHERRPRA